MATPPTEVRLGALEQGIAEIVRLQALNEAANLAFKAEVPPSSPRRRRRCGRRTSPPSPASSGAPREFLPEVAGKALYGLLGSFRLDPSLVAAAEREGLILAGLGSGLLELLNRPGFVPRSFRALAGAGSPERPAVGEPAAAACGSAPGVVKDAQLF